MGIPVFEPPGEGSDAVAVPASCPGNRSSQRRGPIRRQNNFVPGTIAQDGAWSVWTRNIRRRFEILQYADDSTDSQASRSSNEEPSQVEDRGSSREEQNTISGLRHRYSVRFGYDPRVFLDDPARRGQQLTPEAEEWAAAYRSRIPMTTDLQVARRLQPEPVRSAQQQPARPLGRWQSQGNQPPLETNDEATEPPAGSRQNERGSDGNSRAFSMLQRSLWRSRAGRGGRSPDDPPSRLSLLLTSSESPFRSASPQARLAMLGEAISAATLELSEANPEGNGRERERPAERESQFRSPEWYERTRERTGSHQNRFRDLVRLLNESPDVVSRRDDVRGEVAVRVVEQGTTENES